MPNLPITRTFPFVNQCPYISISLNAVLKYLKHATSRGCNAWFVCDGKVLRFNPIALVLFKHISKPIGVVAI